jgi:NAD(P)-dependent dehydrogenase (short-subunit alcohol dehydrogenase family)
MELSSLHPSLRNRVVFITGGATGIGAALVEQFCLQGAKVAYIDFDSESATKLNQQLRTQLGASPWFRKVDATDVDALRLSIVNACEELGPIHTLINNVANDDRHSPQDVTMESWRECLAVNLDASFFATQAATSGMKDSGSIINLSSINALLGPENMPGYVAAKSGLIGLTKSLAKDYGDRNIRVNAILPGWVVTERQLDKWLTPEAEQEWSKLVALKERIMPEDVAKLALFLSSDDSKMITGQSITIAAGRT